MFCYLSSHYAFQRFAQARQILTERENHHNNTKKKTSRMIQFKRP